MEQHTTDEGAWYEIAELLGGRTVEEWKAVMGHREFVGWVVHINNKRDDERHRK